ncbi:MAG: ATP-NAD kinase family protein [Kangiellaceae bacterium]|nr:ATP-NAD kinase family protein [Kangiellaceae bacterium]
MFTLGLIINPFAGIGGKVGLKGSDGADIRQQAFERGAIAQSANRARMALQILKPYKEQLLFFTAANDMGQNLLEEQGFKYQVVHHYQAQSSAQDTIDAAQAMADHNINVLLFAGGDGTARDIYQAIGDTVPVLGIPAGVKIHSGVYAVTPRAAGLVIEQMIKGELVSLLETSVMDIDEEAFRQGKVRAKQYGEMQVPAEHRYVQATKSGGKEVEAMVLQDIAEYIVEQMDDDIYYLVGSGTTCAAVMDALDLPNTLLGIDIVHQEQLIQADVYEKHILQLLEQHPKKVKAIITIIGGQGHIIGRGNQQLSATALQQLGKDNLIVIATKTKLNQLAGKPLIIDSDDSNINLSLAGPIKVITGYEDFVLYPVATFE